MKSQVRRLADAIAGACKEIADNAKVSRCVVTAYHSASWEELVAQLGQLDSRRKVRVFGHLMDNIDIDHRMSEAEKCDVTETLEGIITGLATHLRDVHPDIKAALECREFSWAESGSILDFDFWELFAEWAKFKVGLRGNASR